MSLNHLNGMYAMMLERYVPLPASSVLAIPVTTAERIRLYSTGDYSTYTTVSVAPNDGIVNCFSPDGDLFVVRNGTGAEKFHIWQTGINPDARTWTKLTAPATMPSAAITDAKFSPDGQYLAVAIEGGQVVLIYETSGWTTLGALNPVPFDAYSLSWNGSSTKLAVAGVNTTAVYSIPALTRDAVVASTSRSILFHPTADELATSITATPFVKGYNSSLSALSPALPAASGSLENGNSLCFAGAKLITSSTGELSPANKPVTFYDWTTKTVLSQPALTIVSGRDMSLKTGGSVVAISGTDGGSNIVISLVNTDTMSEISVFSPSDFAGGALCQISYSPF